MEILELVEVVNSKLKSGLSTSKIEKEMNFGKDTLRKKLNREGYRFNKNIKQYVRDECEIAVDKISDETKSNCFNKKNEIMNIKSNNENLSTDEIEFIKKLYSQHKKNIEINNIEFDDVIIRSIRVSKNAMNLFAQYCKDNNLSQTKALSEALIQFVKNK